ncbi:MAG: SprB repeat-containing protein [Bacteroidetes bacterium]|nr:SprB repeat-containing protein [Bacteroidota bacterium]
MNNISGLSINVANTSSACFANNGSISLTGTGGIAPLQYSINGTIYQSSAVFTGLAGGTYTVYVKDANGCIVTATTSITISQGPSITATALNASCGANNGAIIANRYRWGCSFTIQHQWIHLSSRKYIHQCCTGNIHGLCKGCVELHWYNNSRNYQYFCRNCNKHIYHSI